MTEDIKYILEKIEIWLNDGKLYDNEDAKVFVYALDHKFDELAEMLKEIDREFQNDT